MCERKVTLQARVWPQFMCSGCDLGAGGAARDRHAITEDCPAGKIGDPPNNLSSKSAPRSPASWRMFERLRTCWPVMTERPPTGNPKRSSPIRSQTRTFDKSRTNNNYTSLL